MEAWHLFASLGCPLLPPLQCSPLLPFLPSPSPTAAPAAAKIPGEASCAVPCSTSSETITARLLHICAHSWDWSWGYS